MRGRVRQGGGVRGRRGRRLRNDQDQLDNPPPQQTPHILPLFPIPQREEQSPSPTFGPGPSTPAPWDVSVELTLGRNPSGSEPALFQETQEAEMGGGNEPREGSSWWAEAQELYPVFNQEQEPQPSAQPLPFPSYQPPRPPPLPFPSYQPLPFPLYPPPRPPPLPFPSYPPPRPPPLQFPSYPPPPPPPLQFPSYPPPRPPPLSFPSYPPPRPPPLPFPSYPPPRPPSVTTRVPSPTNRRQERALPLPGAASPLRPTPPLPPLCPPSPVPSDVTLELTLGLQPSQAEPETLFQKVHRMVSKQGRRHGNDEKGAP